MPRFTGRFTAIRLKSGEFTKDLHQQMQINNRTAARAWVRAVIQLVPVWSGESRGSIKFATGSNGFLGSFLRVAVPINPVKGGTRKNKNATTGEAHYDFVAETPVYLFKFNSLVPQYMHHEFFARPAGINQQIIAPWRSLEAGRLAYKAAIRAELKKLPKITKYFLRVQIPFGA